MTNIKKYSLQMVKESSVPFETISVASSGEAKSVARACGHLHSPCEEFWVIALNTKCKPLGMYMAGKGTGTTTVVDVRGIFQFLLAASATRFIISHNHPSGISSPSDEDLQLTERIGNAADVLGMQLLDHIILGEDSGDYSFKEHGLI